MTTLTLIDRDETTARISMADGKGHTATLKVWSDGSHQVQDGAAWMVKQIRGRALGYALSECRKTGSATVEAR